MTFLKKFAYGASVAALAAMAPVAAVHAQQITSDIRGQITDQNGAPISGASVQVIHQPSGSVSNSVTSAGGVFSARGLRVGGPYTVTITANGYQPRQVEGISLNLGETFRLDQSLEASQATEVIVVTGSAIQTVETAIGPNATFGQDVLTAAPAINRSLGDIVRIDPRIYVDESFVDAIQCAGANPRFNSLTVDGVRLNDGFGLNSNGFPTESQPFSYDAIEQVAVELAPYDVRYGGFSACNINAVTKSGGNEFRGGFFVDYTSDSLTGSSLEGNSVTIEPFDDYRYGINVGGPIIQDRLFFFAAYERREGTNTFDRGPEGSGATVEISGFTLADFEEIRRISRDVYNYDPGGIPSSYGNTDEKFLLRLDWEINNNHRASFVYNYNDGFNITQSDGGNSQFEYSNHLYERGAELNSYTASLFSDWTNNFSTEMRLSYIDLVNRQNSLDTDGFGEVQIRVGGNTIYLGGDDSRQSNELNYSILSAQLRGNYQLDNHSISFGYEREQYDIYNLFVQHTIGEFRFNSIADFENGFPSAIYYNNAPSQNPADAAADWGYAINTVFVQDEWQVTPNLTITGGLRYDWYTTSDAPPENPDFVADYGFSNSQTLDGTGLIQPRFAVQWDVSDTLTVRGGIGLFSGGNPNVWLSNNYSANNVTQFGQRGRNFGYTNGTRSLFDADVVYPNGLTPGFAVPQELVDGVAAGVGDNFEINYLDPSFNIPAEWKFSLGATWLVDVPLAGFLGGEYIVNADLLFNRAQNSAVIRRGDLDQVGTAVAGIPVFASNREPSFVLTNATRDVDSFNFGLTVQREYDFGLSWVAGYSYSDAQDIQPMTSSVAFSNYSNRAYFNPQVDEIAQSNYNVPHRFTLLLNYEHEFVQEYRTRFTLFGQAAQGRPYGYGFASNSVMGFNPFQEGASSLLYVPTGPSDPNVAFAGGFDVDGFFSYLEQQGLMGYAGGFVPRNAFNSDWWIKADLRIEQELPGLRDGHRSAAFIVIDNLPNLINDEWGIFRQASFPGTIEAASAGLINGGNQIEYRSFNPNRVVQGRQGSASLWSVRIGLRYEF
ncbi:TonB-dependent receptor [Glycocaulis abyssi]|uniref:TonB-dependent receptor domain-containing protein n=1 Tax=Glycocaulis abyssi TaxID=1433403 RepID=A0ABV9NBF3_9PROT